MTSTLLLSNIFPLAFGIPSGPDLFFLLIIVLVLFGAKRLPEIARSLGQSVNEFKKAKEEFEQAANKTTTSVSSSPTVEASASSTSADTTQKS